jgi:hypothetical protein
MQPSSSSSSSLHVWLLLPQHLLCLLKSLQVRYVLGHLSGRYNSLLYVKFNIAMHAMYTVFLGDR